MATENQNGVSQILSKLFLIKSAYNFPPKSSQNSLKFRVGQKKKKVVQLTYYFILSLYFSIHRAEIYRNVVAHRAIKPQFSVAFISTPYLPPHHLIDKAVSLRM